MKEYLSHINGFNVIEDKNLSPDSKRIQFKFPKSKKKRIRKKWLKRNENYKTIETERFIKFDNTIIVSTKSYNKLKKLLKTVYL